MTAADATVLGRILVMQNALQTAPDVRRIGEMFCAALDDLPGLKACALYSNQQRVAQSAFMKIDWPMSWAETESRFASDPSYLWLPLQTLNKTYGYLAILVSDPEDFQVYRPHLENTANTIALALENKAQAAELANLNRNLETQIKDRIDSLQQSEARLSLALKGAKCGLWDWNIATGQVYFDPNYYLIAGYQPDAFPHDFDEWRKRVHPEDIGPTEARLKQYLSGTADSFSVEFRFKTAAGEWLWLFAQGEIVERNPSGDPLRMSGLHIDIGELKTAEAALQESEDRFRRLAENAKDAIYRMALPSGRYEYMSPAALDLFGYSPQEFYAEDGLIKNIIHPDWQDFFKEEWEKLLSGQMPTTYEYQIVQKSGKEKWLYQRNVLVLGEDGKPAAIEGIVTDITDRKTIETERQLSNERFMTVLNSIDAGIYVADMETYEILFMNQYMIKDFGQDFTGQICWEAFRGESKPCEICNNHLLLDETGQPTGVHTWQGSNPITGKEYINHDRAIRWTDGRLARIQIASNITELKRLEAQLRQKFKMEAVGVMAGGIAHDFNNHLAIILGNIELAQMKSTNGSPVSSHLKDAKTASIRARDLVHQILTYSRRGILQGLKPTLLSQVVEETLQLLRATIPTSVIIRQEILTPAIISADPVQVQQLLINLCNNAVYAMADKGELQINLSCQEVEQADIPTGQEASPGHFARLMVTDNGAGMTATTLEKAFDPFFTTKSAGDGTGMGLAVVHGIVKSHGGFVTIESSPELGTRLDVYFPIIEQTASEILTDAPEQLKGTEKILFVDDEEMMVDVWSRILKEYGYQVTSATDSRVALKLFTQTPEQFDLMITDQTMPYLSGKELIAQCLSIRPDLPTILCTGFSNKVSEEDIVELGIRAFCMKPLEPNQFTRTVRAVLDAVKETISPRNDIDKDGQKVKQAPG